jgi:hypothetical protein
VPHLPRRAWYGRAACTHRLFVCEISGLVYSNLDGEQRLKDLKNGRMYRGWSVSFASLPQHSQTDAIDASRANPTPIHSRESFLPSCTALHCVLYVLPCTHPCSAQRTFSL